MNKPGDVAPQSITERLQMEQQKLLSIGFRVGLVLATACLVGVGIYLGYFLTNTNRVAEGLIGASAPAQEIAFTSLLALAYMSLISCGVMLALALGCFGFTLFLLGIKSEVNAEGEGAGYKIKLEKMAPGLFVILCAAVLAAICITRSPPAISITRDSPVSKSPDLGGETHTGKGSTAQQEATPGGNTAGVR